MSSKIDIEPKPLDKIPVKPIEELVREAIHNLDGVKVELPKVNWTTSDTANVIKKLIGELTIMVYNGKLTVTFWAIIIVVALFILMKLLKIM